MLDAIADCDVLLLPPSNPVVSIGTILGVPGIRDAIRETAAPVIGVSPIIGTGPVRGMADKVLAAIGVESTAAAVGDALRRPRRRRRTGRLADRHVRRRASWRRSTAAGIDAPGGAAVDERRRRRTAAIADAALNLAEAVRR